MCNSELQDTKQATKLSSLACLTPHPIEYAFGVFPQRSWQRFLAVGKV